MDSREPEFVSTDLGPLGLVEQYGATYRCPRTGLIVPKDPVKNLAWRKKVLSSCETSFAMREHVYAACSKSCIYWINLFGWTHRPKAIDSTGKEVALTDARTHVPFITWKVQDEIIEEIIDAIVKGRDIAIDKSRDMGATWVCLMVFLWFWLFKSGVTFLMLSRKESLVDRRGSMDSLFEKLRYAIRWLPNWMQPNIRDTFMHLENLDNGSVIDGESTNEHAGQASRSTATLLDEFARVPNGEAIDMATADTSACRIFNSTPGSPSAYYTRIIRQKRCRILQMPWWRHPEKGRGMRLIPPSEEPLSPLTQKPVTILGKGADLPKPPGKESWKWVSPWYIMENERRQSLRNISQNLDMEHGRVGDMVFDTEMIEKHRAAFARQPDMVGNIVFPEDLSDKSKKGLLRALWTDRKGTNPLLTQVRFSTYGGSLGWRLWIPLVEYKIGSGDSEVTIYRPDQSDRYVFGVDISAGTGASNSIISVKSHTTGKIVAKFWDAYTTPEQLADIAMFAAAWFGGVKPPYIVFEKNGPGMQFGKKLVDFCYPAIYYQTIDGQKGKQRTKRWGWHSSNQRKELLVGEYRDALASGKIINPCHEALDEALDYVFDTRSRLIPGSVGEDESSGATATHGDHVIADALTVLGSADLPKMVKTDEEAREPYGSFAYRRRQYWKSRREREAWEF